MADVDIANNALIRLGDQTITALTENSDRARAMNKLYLPTLRKVLRGHNWNFATFRAALAARPETPVSGYDYMFQLPTDPEFLFVRSTDLDEDEPYEIESYQNTTGQYRVLVTDSSTVTIVYVGLVTDTSLWDPLFTAAMEIELAHQACYAITKNASLMAELRPERQEAWRLAKSRDGQEARKLERLRSLSLTRVRL